MLPCVREKPYPCPVRHLLLPISNLLQCPMGMILGAKFNTGGAWAGGPRLQLSHARCAATLSQPGLTIVGVLPAVGPPLPISAAMQPATLLGSVN